MARSEKRARDADRNLAIEFVQNAWVDGQLARDEHEERVERVLRAATASAPAPEPTPRGQAEADATLVRRRRQRPALRLRRQARLIDNEAVGFFNRPNGL